MWLHIHIVINYTNSLLQGYVFFYLTYQSFVLGTIVIIPSTFWTVVKSENKKQWLKKKTNFYIVVSLNNNTTIVLLLLEIPQWSEPILKSFDVLFLTLRIDRPRSKIIWLFLLYEQSLLLEEMVAQ